MINDFKQYRVTYTLMALLMANFVLNYFRQGTSSFSETSFFQTLLNNFSHFRRFHLVLSLLALYNYRYLEALHGHLYYCLTLVCLLLPKTFIYYFLLNEESPISLGFFGIILGLMTIYPEEKIFGFNCDCRYYSIIILFLVQLIPQYSFYANLSGVLSGYLFLALSPYLVTTEITQKPQSNLLRQRKSHLYKHIP